VTDLHAASALIVRHRDRILLETSDGAKFSIGKVMLIGSNTDDPGLVVKIKELPIDMSSSNPIFVVRIDVDDPVETISKKAASQECTCSSCSSPAEHEGYCHLCNAEGCR
jgi:hypothetical protein